MGKYDDIINLPHHESSIHPRMPIESRAAQFAPFAALSGHEEAISEEERITEPLKELSDNDKSRISEALHEAIDNKRLVRISYFCPDNFKKGGSYKTTEGKIKKWEETDNNLIFENGLIIKIPYIYDINFPG